MIRRVVVDYQTIDVEDCAFIISYIILRSSFLLHLIYYDQYCFLLLLLAYLLLYNIIIIIVLLSFFCYGLSCTTLIVEILPIHVRHLRLIVQKKAISIIIIVLLGIAIHYF